MKFTILGKRAFFLANMLFCSNFLFGQLKQAKFAVGFFDLPNFMKSAFINIIFSLCFAVQPAFDIMKALFVAKNVL